MRSVQSLPLSQAQTTEAKAGPGIRRRLSSLSLNLKIQAPSSSPAAAWASKSGTSIRKWWEWALGWILSRKPTFASDLEMNEEESAALGTHNRGSWRHVFYKATSELRRRLLGADNAGLPQTFRYDTLKKKKFDDGSRSAPFLY